MILIYIYYEFLVLDFEYLKNMLIEYIERLHLHLYYEYIYLVLHHLYQLLFVVNKNNDHRVHVLLKYFLENNHLEHHNQTSNAFQVCKIQFFGPPMKIQQLYNCRIYILMSNNDYPPYCFI